MNKAMPVIRESADQLKQLLNRERHSAKQQRLHALYLLASGQARRRSEVADLLGRDRNTISRWLVQYDQGGLPALLKIYVPAGKRKPLSSEQLAQLQQALQQPQGFASYAEVRQWLATTFGVQMSYNAVYKLVHNKLKAKPKVARPTHEKKPYGRGPVSPNLCRMPRGSGACQVVAPRAGVGV
jgi:transposase